MSSKSASTARKRSSGSTRKSTATGATPPVKQATKPTGIERNKIAEPLEQKKEPWNDQKDPAALLCRAADKCGYSIRGFVSTFVPIEIPPEIIRQAESLDRMWASSLKRREDELNRKLAMEKRVRDELRSHPEPVSAMTIALNADVTIGGTKRFLEGEVKRGNAKKDKTGKYQYRRRA
jgi:hypothetical protein